MAAASCQCRDVDGSGSGARSGGGDLVLLHFACDLSQSSICAFITSVNRDICSVSLFSMLWIALSSPVAAGVTSAVGESLRASGVCSRRSAVWLE